MSPHPGARCHACRSPWAQDGVPGFKAACDACSAQLHVCRNCDLHDPRRHNECMDPTTEWVSFRDRANSCEEFRWKRPAKWAAPKEGSRRALDALLGAPGDEPRRPSSLGELLGGKTEEDPGKKSLDDLFGPPSR